MVLVPTAKRRRLRGKQPAVVMPFACQPLDAPLQLNSEHLT